jgi:hypothetical protein
MIKKLKWLFRPYKYEVILFSRFSLNGYNVVRINRYTGIQKILDAQVPLKIAVNTANRLNTQT